MISDDRIMNIFMQGRTGTKNRPGQFQTTTLPALPNLHSTCPTLPKFTKSPVFHTKITLFITSTLPANRALPKCKNGQSASVFTEDSSVSLGFEVTSILTVHNFYKRF